MNLCFQKLLSALRAFTFSAESFVNQRVNQNAGNPQTASSISILIDDSIDATRCGSILLTAICAMHADVYSTTHVLYKLFAKPRIDAIRGNDAAHECYALERRSSKQGLTHKAYLCVNVLVRGQPLEHRL